MDEVYVLARTVLLDALEALGPHRNAVVVVGAQAVYQWTGSEDLAVPPHTTDGDLMLDPAVLAETPPLERMLRDAGFATARSGAVGVWQRRGTYASQVDRTVDVDLLVPRSVSPGQGRRAARLAGHEARAARIVRGLEGALVDHAPRLISSLEPGIQRTLSVRVAGPAALLVAKLHKISERQGSTRAADKDALDVYRLLRAVDPADVADRVARLLADERSRSATLDGIALLQPLFGRGGEGAEMAARALAGLVDPDEVTLGCAFLVDELVEAIRSKD